MHGVWKWGCVFEVEKALLFNLEKFRDNDRNHHEETRNVLQRFSKYVNNLNIFKEPGNPFLEESLDLLALEARDIADTKAIETLSSAERIVKKQYHKFLRTNKKSI